MGNCAAEEQSQTINESRARVRAELGREMQYTSTFRKDNFNLKLKSTKLKAAGFRVEQTWNDSKGLHANIQNIKYNLGRRNHLKIRNLHFAKDEFVLFCEWLMPSQVWLLMKMCVKLLSDCNLSNCCKRLHF